MTNDRPADHFRDDWEEAAKAAALRRGASLYTWRAPDGKDNTGFVLALNRPDDSERLVYQSWRGTKPRVTTLNYADVEPLGAKEIFILLHGSDAAGLWGLPAQHVDSAKIARSQRPGADCYAVLLDGHYDRGFILSEKDLDKLSSGSSSTRWVKVKEAGAYRRFLSIDQSLDLLSDPTREGASGPLIPGPGDPFCHPHGRQKRRESGVWICSDCGEAKPGLGQ